MFYKRLPAAAVIPLFFLAVHSNCQIDSDGPPDFTGHLPADVRASFSQGDYLPLAQYWAPRVYHDTNDDYYVGDFITNFNFDGDYNGKNNWENLAGYSTVPAYVYYMVSETETHYFLGYYFFHPRDWSNVTWPNVGQQHENDLEGISVVVKKDGSTYGSLVSMVSHAHGHHYQYAWAGGITSGSDNVDGSISVYSGSHPEVFIEDKGHGVYGCDSRCDSAPGGDGIVYYEGGWAESPSTGAGNYTQHISYKLIAMDADGSEDGNEGFWHRRNDICDTCTFGEWGRIRGDNHAVNSPNAPWAYDDPDDGQSYVGDIACNPALMHDVYLNGTPFDSGFSHTYVNHIYRTHSFQVTYARSDKNRDPWGGKSDIYVKVRAAWPPHGSDEVMGERAWKKNSASTGTWYPFTFGGYDATGEHSFGDTVQTHSFCRPGSPAVNFSVYDSDNGGDDHMGTITLYNSASYFGGVDLGDARIAFGMTKY